MTTRDDDQDLDAFLNGEDDLSALLRGLPQPEPEPELDARIQAQAREALAVPPTAANDSAPAEALPGPRTPLGRLRTPLALAATLVIGVSLGLQWNGWREPAKTLSDAEAPAHAPAARVEDGPAASPSAPAMTVDAGAAGTQARPGDTHGRRHAAPAANPPAPALPAVDPAVVQAHPVPTPAAPALAPLDGFQRRAAPAPWIAPAPLAPEPAPVEAPAPPPPPPPAPAARSPVAPAPPDVSTYATVTGSRVAARAEPDAGAWLARITALLDQHRDAEARASWQAFRRAFPEAEVPPALQARIDALPSAEAPAP